MSCQVDVSSKVKSDILDCRESVIQEIGDFLLALQENPLPEDRHDFPTMRYMKDTVVFYKRLPCGYFVSWEVFGDLMEHVLTGKTKGIVVRVLGIGTEQI